MKSRRNSLRQFISPAKDGTRSPRGISAFPGKKDFKKGDDGQEKLVCQKRGRTGREENRLKERTASGVVFVLRPRPSNSGYERKCGHAMKGPQIALESWEQIADELHGEFVGNIEKIKCF